MIYIIENLGAIMIISLLMVLMPNLSAGIAIHDPGKPQMAAERTFSQSAAFAYQQSNRAEFLKN